MLEYLHLKNVGPAPEMELALAPRLNLLTGDNGLGKSFLLDVSWFALTRTWPQTWSGKGVVPDREHAAIDWRVVRDPNVFPSWSRYDFDDAAWHIRDHAFDPQGSGELVVYVRVDGGISVHDPLRIGEDFRLATRERTIGRSNAFQFTDSEIWNGLTLDGGDASSRVCEGLVRDVVRWAVESDSAEFARLAALVEQLAGHEPFRLSRKVGRVYIDDARDYPYLVGPSGEEPISRAPAGLRRILGLAYLVVWAWREHRIAAALKKRPPSNSLVLLFDEVENHLHPRWQRTILPNLLRGLNDEVRLQVVASTHSPLVLASVEPIFDEDKDKLFHLDLEAATVRLREEPWAKQGDVVNWLVSDVFGLEQGRSIEAERAIEAAEAWMRGAHADLPAELSTEAAIHAELMRVLPGHDHFWPRWIVSREKAAAP